MLKELTIINFAIIEKLEIELSEGLIVLTGETGAGKSIIADAITFLFGARASSDMIKTGATKTIIEGTFFIEDSASLKNWFDDNGFEFSDNQIILSRELTLQGSKARINGSIANISQLSYLKNFLYDSHEQSEYLSLLKPEKQLEIIDHLGSEKHQKLIASFQESFQDYMSIKNALDKKIQDSSEVSKQIELLMYQVNEIEEANIDDVLEEEELTNQRNILLNKKELIEKANLIYEILNGENDSNILAQLSTVKKTLNGISEYDSSFEDFKVESIYEELKELSSMCANYFEDMHFEGKSLDEIENRLDQFYKLRKKYGESLSEVINFGMKAKKELKDLENLSLSKEELELKFKEKAIKSNELSSELSKSRNQIIQPFIENMNKELLSLGFKEVDFKVNTIKAKLSLLGKDVVEFIFSSNPGEPLKPIQKIASGGELSRIMLAIKTVEAIESKNTLSKLLIFDEVDSGVSGEVASSVARKLYKISRSNQVICITHQPIVAAMADENIFVRKKILQNKTIVEVMKVSEDQREDILAALINPMPPKGSALSTTGLRSFVSEGENEVENISLEAKKYAKSLLEMAKKQK